VPFDGEDGIAILFGHVTTPVPTPTLETDAERALFAIVRRMMAKDPDHRVQDGDELLRLLDATPGAGTRVEGATGGVALDGDVTPLVGLGNPIAEARGEIVREWAADAARRQARRRRWAIAGAAVVVVGAAAYAVGARVTRGTPAEVAPVVSALPVVAAVPAPVVSTEAPVAPRAAACDATGGTTRFHVVLDPLAARRDAPVEIAYAVCGLTSGTHFRTVVTLSRHESGIKKLLGSSDRTTVVFDDRAGGSAVRARHRLPRLDAGTYAVTVTVTDARGRRRAHDTTLAIPSSS
jgi:hypothetical protein